MPLPALNRLERKIEEFKKGPLGRKIEIHKRKFEQKLDIQKKKFQTRIRNFEAKNGARLDDKVSFLRHWFEKPLAMGSVTPSGKALARTMAGYIDLNAVGPVIELGPGTGPVTEALVEYGIDPARLILIEYDPNFCHLLRQRYPTATVVQGDAYSLRRTLGTLLLQPVAAVVSGLPLLTKPVKTRLELLYEAFELMAPDAPFIQFTYGAVSPIPRSASSVKSQGSERIWANIPPARVWVYRKG